MSLSETVVPGSEPRFLCHTAGRSEGQNPEKNAAESDCCWSPNPALISPVFPTRPLSFCSARCTAPNWGRKKEGTRAADERGSSPEESRCSPEPDSEPERGGNMSSTRYKKDKEIIADYETQVKGAVRSGVCVCIVSASKPGRPGAASISCCSSVSCSVWKTPGIYTERNTREYSKRE